MHILRTGEVTQIRLFQDLLCGPQGIHSGSWDDPGLGTGISAASRTGKQREGGPFLETDEPWLDDTPGDAAAAVAMVYGDDREVFGVLGLRSEGEFGRVGDGRSFRELWDVDSVLYGIAEAAAGQGEWRCRK
ncbi:hypothetical protein V492_02089 [Pseudogymnoascus sp. VKM F-4246]|nr:hypothetical protein V492_02089 [Pseudogymnoascus sp. VKM F-4246]